MKVELSESEIWTLIEVLDCCAEELDAQGASATDYIEKLNGLEAKLKAVVVRPPLRREK